MKALFFTLFLFSFLFSEQRTLRISNFIDYIDISVLKEFASKNNLKIIYDVHEVNEDIYQKVKDNNNYDVVIVSSNYVTKLKNIDKLEKIDYSKLQNYSNINQQFLETNFKNSVAYAIPYLFGTVGLIYNKKLVKTPIERWDDLWKEEFRNSILLSNEPSDVLAMSLKSLNYSANTLDTRELNLAYEKLKKLIPNIKNISSSNAINYFIINDFKVGMAFSGDAKLIIDNSKDFEFVYPKEGALKWADGMVILKDSQNKDLAYKFIDFILEARNSAKIGNTTGYAISNKKGINFIDKEELSNHITYPTQNDLINSEILIEHPETYIYILDRFEKFKEQYKNRKGL